jgi:hypothetical protein
MFLNQEGNKMKSTPNKASRQAKKYESKKWLANKVNEATKEQNAWIDTLPEKKKGKVNTTKQPLVAVVKKKSGKPVIKSVYTRKDGTSSLQPKRKK